MSDKYNGVYPTAWTQREIAVYEQLGQEPPKTRNGLWVGDVEREARDLADWSLAELFALANNELYTQQQPGTGDFYRTLRTKALLVDKDALKWSEEELYDWLLFERTPERTPNGNYLNDPARWTKDASTWNDSELVDLGCGYFGELDRSKLYILDEACERFDLPLGITFEDYCAYIRDRIKPELTSNGVLINDRRRASKAVADWTDDELQAYALGELEPDSTDEALLARALDAFGGEWYWDRASLLTWVRDEEIPEVDLDYSRFSTDQLKRLVREENDTRAYEVLEKSLPLPNAIDHSWWDEDQRRNYLLDGVIPEEPVEVVEPEELPEPEPETVETPEPETLDEVVVEEEVLEEPEPEEELPPVTPTVWTDLVTEDSPLFDALSVSTSDEIIADSEQRTLLSASRWSLAELVGWARGLIPAGLNTTEATLIAALRLHCGPFVTNWTDDAVKSFIALHELPEGFDSGMLVEDVIRDKKHPGDWTDEELTAYAAGKIRTATAKPDEIMLTLRVRFNVPGHLNDEQVKRFVANGEYEAEVIAPITVANIASDAQLKAWLDGNMTVSPELEAELFNLVRGRHRIDAHWTDQQVLAHFRNGTQPTVTADGVLVEDRLRDTSTPVKWTWKELQALNRGEISAEFSPDCVAFMTRVRELIRIQYGHNDVNWSDREVLMFLERQTVPRALESGVYLNDPTRIYRSASEWREVELKAWLSGDIQPTEAATEEQLWHETYVRFKVPVFWYREDAKSYVLHGTEVPATPSGIWLRDRNRDARPAKHWTRREIKAWCRGLILPGINASSEELVNQASRLFGVSALLDDDSIKRRIAEITEESMTMTVKFVTDDLASYAQGREAAGSNALKAAPYQTLLERCISRVLRLEGEDFVQGWTELLLFFHKHSTGITSAKKLYVGVGQMAITPKGLRNFQNMTAILMTTCDPANRDRAVRLTEWTTALKELPNEKARQGLLAYYGVN